MAGSADNASLWTDADVYISTNLSAALPATPSTAFSGDWTLVGLLDGDDGFEENRDEDTKDYFAWGGMLVRTSRKNFKLTKKFSVLEDNVATRSLIWPGSTDSQIIVPRPANIKMAFETREGGKVKRLITRNYAQVSVDGKLTDNESDLTKVTLEAAIFPDSGGVLFDRQAAPSIVSIALSPLTLALTTGLNKFVQAVATYSDATTGNISAQAAWTSSAPTKATVVPSSAGGVVSWVSAGTANVSCTYGGVTATAVCVVTAT